MRRRLGAEVTRRPVFTLVWAVPAVWARSPDDRSGDTSLEAAGEGSRRSASGLFVGDVPDRFGVRRPEGVPCGRATQASEPRLCSVVIPRQTSFSVGAARTLAENRSSRATAAAGRPGCSRSGIAPPSGDRIVLQVNLKVLPGDPVANLKPRRSRREFSGGSLKIATQG